MYEPAAMEVCECHKDPPIILYYWAAEESEPYVESAWPSVMPTEICGKWRKKDDLVFSIPYTIAVSKTKLNNRKFKSVGISDDVWFM